LINLYLLREAAFVLLVALAASFVFSIRWREKRGAARPVLDVSRFAGYAGVCLPLTAIAFATGYLTGFSREPAVTATIPAILTLLGGVFAYAVAAHPGTRGPMALGVVLFSLVLIFTTNYYSGVRERELMKRLVLLSEQEKLIRTRRANMDLPEDFPQWITHGEFPK
jgi:hypothetical protein